jgi:replicative DNA helicase
VPAPSAEALLISALINNEAVGEEIQYGISLADFEGYKDPYGWLANYIETYNCQPTADIFKHKFPDFPLSVHDNIRSAAEAVHQSSNRRRITTAITEAMDYLHLGDADAAHQILAGAAPVHAAGLPRPLLTDVSHLDEWDTRGFAVELPYPSLQRYTGGIRAGNLWYMAGRPSQGKSAHLASFNKQAVKDGNRVLFYSLEMSEEEVRARFHASLATELGYHSITLSALRDRRVDRAMYRKFIGELGERLEGWGGALDVHTPADGPVSPSVVAARCSEYDLTTIDYVGLMSQDGGGMAIDDWRVMARISNSLKTIALAQDARLLCAAQINRDGETGSAPPKVKNLAQSDALGQDGDVVLTMRSKPKNVATHFSLEKNRHGSSGIQFYTTFDPNTGTYTEISVDHAEDLVINAEALASETLNPPRLRVIKSKDEL